MTRVLKRKIEINKKTQSTPKEYEDELKIILENVADGITIQDTEGKLIFANNTAARASGFKTVKELVSTPPKEIAKKFTLLNEKRKPISWDDLPGRKVLKGAKYSETVLLFSNNETKEERWSFLKAQPVFSKDKEIKYVINIFHDITARKRTEEKIRNRERQQVAIAYLSQKALLEISLEEFFNEAVSIVVKTLDIEYGKILQYLPEEDKFLLAAGTGWKKGLVGEARINAGKKSQAGFTFLSNSPVTVKNLSTETRFSGSKLLKDHEVVSGMSVVIVGRTRHYGVFGVHSKSGKKFTKDDLRFLQSITNIVSVQIENKTVQEELRRSEEKFRSIVELAPDVIYSVSEKGNLTEFNAAFEKVTGFSRKDWIGRSYKDLVHKDDVEFAEKQFKEGLSREINAPYLLRLPTKQGKYIVGEFRSIPRIHNGKLQGKLGIFRDVTERIQEEKQRDYLLGIASHELKTPLANIKIFTQILQKQFIKERNLKGTERILKVDQQINRLTKLISDLLDITRIRAGRLELREEEFSFDYLIQEVVEDVSLLSKTHKITLRGSANKIFWGDKDKIFRAILNLATNAVKYSPKAKKIEITVTFVKGIIYISVKDFGIGIPEREQSKIFEPFYHAENIESKNFATVGLGLYISNELIKLHGGKIVVKSVLGKGSEFIISLPVKRKPVKKSYEK